MIPAFRSRQAALAAVALVDVTACVLVDGWHGAVGAVTGLAIVSLFFLGGRAPRLVADRVPPGQLFLLVVLGYVLRVVLLLAALIHLGKAGWLDTDALGVTLVLGALAWSGYLVHQQLNSRQPTIVVALTPSLPSEVAR